MSSTNHTLVPTVDVRPPCGPLVGQQLDGRQRFVGIPFAEPPIGDRRFRPPSRRAPWTTPRDATSFGPVAPQNASSLDQLLGHAEQWDEDCLYLNVWTPAADGAARPVMVWIHGGAFSTGSGSSVLYHGDALVETGEVVVVTINYRLNAFGFLDVGALDPGRQGSGNNGLRDQLAALDWVQENIQAFGGDPENVTVFGESAGAMSVGALLAVAGDGQRFQRAILQSGAAAHVLPAEQAGANAQQFLGVLGVDTIDELLALDPQALLDAEMQMPVGSVLDRIDTADELHQRSMPFGPVVDGVFMTEHPMQSIASGAAAGIELMIGTNTDEYRLWSMLGGHDLGEERLLERLAKLSAEPEAVLAHYRAHPHLVARAGAGDEGREAGSADASVVVSPAEVQTQVMTDLAFYVPAVALLDRLARSASTTESSGARYLYRFDWPSSVGGGLLGSCHALELPFVFGHLDLPGVDGFTGPNAPAELSAAMRQAWTSFAHGQRPELPEGVGLWPVADEGVAVFSTPVVVAPLLDQDTLALWSDAFSWR